MSRVETIGRATISTAALDEWCKERAAKLAERGNAHVRAGKSLDDPTYRLLLGEHRAYLAVRSFIHGTLVSAHQPPDSTS